MNNRLRTTFVILAAVVLAAGLVLAGMHLGRAWWSPGAARHWGMMAGYGWPIGNDARRVGVSERIGCSGSYRGYGYMTPGMMGEGMGGMMAPFGGAGLLGIEPPSLSEVEDVLDEYVAALGEEELTVGEIMVFDNHAYAQIVEESTGIGAMEVLVDPVTLAVTPEPGPNMMWNLRYGHMAGSAMMGGFGHSAVGYEGMQSMIEAWPGPDVENDMPISAQEAVRSAQRYLDAYLHGAEADGHVDPFYGYYTLHINRDGETVGMLSVNGHSGQVFVHTWHGDLLETSEEH